MSLTNVIHKCDGCDRLATFQPNNTFRDAYSVPEWSTVEAYGMAKFQLCEECISKAEKAVPILGKALRAEIEKRKR